MANDNRTIDPADIPPTIDQPIRVGSFIAGHTPFVIDTNDQKLAADLASSLRDLRADSPGDGATTLLVAHRFDFSTTHPWGVWRDGIPCETRVTDDYIRPYVLWEITRIVLEAAAPLVPVHAAAVSRNGHAIVLAGRTHAGCERSLSLAFCAH